jgi:hypothetical protein
MKRSRSIFVSYSSSNKQTVSLLNEDIYEARRQLGRLSFLVSDDQRQLYRKICLYQQQLEECNADLGAIHNCFDGEDGSLENIFQRFYATRTKDLEHQKALLLGLIDIGVRLVVSGKDSVMEFEFRQLEAEIGSYIFLLHDIEGYLHPPFDPGKNSAVKAAIVKRIRERLKELRARVRLLIKKCRLGFLPDLRQRFRSIMRFLFKNLDDCGDDDNALTDLQASLFIITNNKNEKHKTAYWGAARTP